MSHPQVLVVPSESGTYLRYILDSPVANGNENAVHIGAETPARRPTDKTIQRVLLGWRALEIFIAETVGTAILVFFGCMSLVAWPDNSVHPFQGALVFATIVATIIQIFGHISAAHLNPAVTIAFVVLGQTTPGWAVVYVISECIGAIIGYGLLLKVTPESVLSEAPRLCCTAPHEDLSDFQAVAVEFIATFVLVMVVCATSDPRNADKGDSVPLKFFCTILAISIDVGPYTGASLNPARSMAPALLSGDWDRQWVYWVGPSLSGFCTAVFYQCVFKPRQADDFLVPEELDKVHVITQKPEKAGCDSSDKFKKK